MNYDALIWRKNRLNNKSFWFHEKYGLHEIDFAGKQLLYFSQLSFMIWRKILLLQFHGIFLFSGASKFELVHHFLEKHVDRRKKMEFEICQWCQEVFENSDRLENHHSQFHHIHGIPRKGYFCHKKLCTYGKFNFKLLQQHMLTDHKSEIPYEPFKCQYCPEMFLIHEEMSHHMNEKHNLNLVRFQCETCPMAFYDKTAYFIHKKSHDKDFVLIFCNICNTPSTSYYEAFCHHAMNHR